MIGRKIETKFSALLSKTEIIQKMDGQFPHQNSFVIAPGIMVKIFVL